MIWLVEYDRCLLMLVALFLLASFGSVEGQSLTELSPIWQYIFPDASLVVTSRNYGVAVSNATHLIVAGGEDDTESTSALPALIYALRKFTCASVCVFVCGTCVCVFV